MIAEAPFDAPLDEYRARVGQENVRHVGVVYGLLAVLFSSPATLSAPDDPDAWRRFVAQVADAVGARTSPGAWHVPEEEMDAGSLALQADAADFPSSREGFIIERIATSADARAAVRRIGLQGEAPVDEQGMPSHYARFRSLAEGAPGVIAFPMAHEFEPSFAVADDPRLGDYAEPALGMARECDEAYASMIRALHEYLAPGPHSDRAALAEQAIVFMRDVKRLAKGLVKLTQKPGSDVVASPVFTPPARS